MATAESSSSADMAGDEEGTVRLELTDGKSRSLSAHRCRAQTTSNPVCRPLEHTLDHRL